MKIRIWHIAFFIVALLAIGAWQAPISLFVKSNPNGLQYERASGSIWKARLAGARLGRLDAGEIRWRLSLFDLAQGKVNAHLDFSGGAIDGVVNLLANFRGDRRLIAPALTIQGAPLDDEVMLEGPTKIEGLDLYFSEGRCVTAQGRLTSGVLQRNERTLNWRGPELAGAASCQQDAAQLALRGAQDGDVIQTMVELGAGGEGRWRTYVDTRKATLRAFLATRGFAPSGAGSNLMATKEFTWLPI